MPQPIPLFRLVDVSTGYRVAVEAFSIAAAHDASDAVLAALWQLCQNEAAKVERSL